MVSCPFVFQYNLIIGSNGWAYCVGSPPLNTRKNGQLLKCQLDIKSTQTLNELMALVYLFGKLTFWGLAISPGIRLAYRYLNMYLDK